MKNNRLFLFVFLLLFACSHNGETYIFVTGPETTSYYGIGKIISETVEKETGIQLNITQKLGQTAIKNLELLNLRECDFIISQNDVVLQDQTGNGKSLIENGIRSVVPLYPQVFLIIYHKDLQPKSLRDLIVGRKVGLPSEISGTYKFAMHFFDEFGIDETEFTPVPHESFEENVLSDEVQVICLLTGFNNPRIRQNLNRGGLIFNIDDPQLAGNGSSIDGFCLNYPLAHPFVVPRYTYGKYPKRPILTAAVDAVMLTHEDVDNDVVYDIIKTIIEYKQHMASSHDNELVSQFSEQFLASNLHFPLHTGARQYIERNKPTFVERWAETMALSFSILVAFVGFVRGFATWNSKRRKNRIDRYYMKVLDVQKEIRHYDTILKCTNAIEKLKRLQVHAFKELIAEKLMADESFRIFVSLLQGTILDIKQKQEEIQRRGN
ncbi:MAG: TAXI family TRAP transporter solute-binding subunit [Deferribacteres bacterium]|nr:TAXI family TRAP transporter solute-binding subunit [candidate division KSB1 bacterium]MCB9503042.1 TAXI family TRAP transporter solute-binding subunit [Deferribacteres bacterium]